VSDDAVRLFAACGTYAELPAAVADRFGGAADSIDIHFPAGAPAELVKEIVTDIQRIPQGFAGFNTHW
jgi:hypothetical protein